MKPILRKIDCGYNNSFSIREDIYPFLYNHWHYHPEVELTLIRKGSGTRLVGDSMEQFSNGDLILLGADLPHLWKSDTEYFEGRPELQIEAIAVHFNQSFWGESFLSLPEMRLVKNLLNHAKRGIKITGETRRLLEMKMEGLLHASEAHRVSGLLEILHLIASSGDYIFLTTSGFNKASAATNNDKINSIYSYTLKNFNKPISMKKIAEDVDISPNSFCRYFKTRTLKTYGQFLLEVRIGHACKLLIENKTSIADICYECGFNNLSNFNRQFKAMLKMTPMQYSKAYAPVRV